MAIKTYRSIQFLPISIERAWDFFSSPRNLNEITPDDMTFRITSDIPEKMYEGLIITYKVTPIFNITLTWVTEITSVKEYAYFIDEQRKGPFGFWHHEHHFRQVSGGIEMTDILHYDVGMSFVGQIASKLFVDRRIRNIFEFRENKLKELFAKN